MSKFSYQKEIHVIRPTGGENEANTLRSITIMMCSSTKYLFLFYLPAGSTFLNSVNVDAFYPLLFRRFILLSSAPQFRISFAILTFFMLFLNKDLSPYLSSYLQLLLHIFFFFENFILFLVSLFLKLFLP